MLCSGKLPVANKFLDKRGTGGIKVFRRKFFVPQGRFFFAREPYCVVFQKNSCSGIDYGLERVVSSLPWKDFLSQSAESFIGENFCAVFQKISRSEKLYG